MLTVFMSHRNLYVSFIGFFRGSWTGFWWFSCMIVYKKLDGTLSKDPLKYPIKAFSTGKSKETTKWFCSKTTLGHMLQNCWKPIWKQLNGKFYFTRILHQTVLFPIITYSDRWHMAWLSSTSIFMTIPKNGSTLR